MLVDKSAESTVKTVADEWGILLVRGDEVNQDWNKF